jgi:hypothetical protein
MSGKVRIRNVNFGDELAGNLALSSPSHSGHKVGPINDLFSPQDSGHSGASLMVIWVF